MSDNLEQVIADSVNDAQLDVDTPDVDVSVETPVEAVEAPVEASSEEPAPTPSESVEVPSPVKSETPEAIPAQEQDEFAKAIGVPQMGVGGRENRIPYSRVKKITENRENAIAEVALGRKLNPGEKAADVVKAHVAQIPELQTKVKEYETRLETVGQFEDVMANDPEKFLTMLSKVPAYKEFFDWVRQANEVMAGKPTTQAQEPSQTITDTTDAMPEPDELLADGSKVYSMAGLQKLLEWNSIHTEKRVASKYDTQLKQIEDRYKPMVSEWEKQQRLAATLPTVRKQLEEAKTWPMWEESEAEILEALKSDPQITLHAAYQKVVFPKLIADRNKVRQDVIKEVKSAPTSTAVPSRAATKPTAPTTSGNRRLEDVIASEIEKLKR